MYFYFPTKDLAYRFAKRWNGIVVPRGLLDALLINNPKYEGSVAAVYIPRTRFTRCKH